MKNNGEQGGEGARSPILQGFLPLFGSFPHVLLALLALSQMVLSMRVFRVSVNLNLRDVLVTSKGCEMCPGGEPGAASQGRLGVGEN